MMGGEVTALWNAIHRLEERVKTLEDLVSALQKPIQPVAHPPNWFVIGPYGKDLP